MGFPVMSKVIDFKKTKPRRPTGCVWPTGPGGACGSGRTATPQKDLRRLSPEELRRGGVWGPAVDRGRQCGADLRLI